jgi:hypothetical protein
MIGPALVSRRANVPTLSFYGTGKRKVIGSYKIAGIDKGDLF